MRVPLATLRAKHAALVSMFTDTLAPPVGGE